MPLNVQQQTTICTMYSKGRSAYEIARAFGIWPQSVYAILHKASIKVRHPWMTASQIEDIKRMYTEGSSADKVAQALGIGRTSVMRALKKAGIPTRHRRHTVNANAFSELSPESAYWIGFLMADGCVQRPKSGMPRISVTLQKRDRGHLEKLRHFVEATYAIRESAKGTQNVLRFGSFEIADDLACYGVVPRKTLTTKVIGLENNRDFWRGELDGDGCLGRLGPRRRPYLELAGSKHIVEQFKAFVLGIVPKNGTNVLKRPVNCYTFRVNGSRAIEVIRALYSDCVVALDRKNLRAQELMQSNE